MSRRTPREAQRAEADTGGVSRPHSGVARRERGTDVADLSTIPTPDLVQLLSSAGQRTASADTPRQRRLALRVARHPSLRFGRALRLDFKLRLQEDARDPGDEPVGLRDLGAPSTCASASMARSFNRIQFSIERELYERETRTRTRSSQINDRRSGRTSTSTSTSARPSRCGPAASRFRSASRQLTGISNLDFVYRSLGRQLSDAVARHRPGRARPALRTAASTTGSGGFKHDGDNSRSRKIQGGDETFAARVTAHASGTRSKGPGVLEISAAIHEQRRSPMSPVLPNGLRGRTVMSQFTFYEPVFVKGHRTRLEADAELDGRAVLGARRSTSG